MAEIIGPGGGVFAKLAVQTISWKIPDHMVLIAKGSSKFLSPCSLKGVEGEVGVAVAVLQGVEYFCPF